jgi:hypothetical protein
MKPADAAKRFRLLFLSPCSFIPGNHKDALSWGGGDFFDNALTKSKSVTIKKIIT